MKCITTTLQILAITFMVAGCASSPASLQAPPTNIACIEGGAANVLRHFSEGEAHVALSPEGGSPAGPYGRHCIPAGKVTLFLAVSNGPYNSSERVMVSFDGGHNYQARANLGSGGFQVHIVDVTSNPEMIAYDFQMKYGMLPTAAQARDLTTMAK